MAYKESAYIKTVPEIVKMSLPYQDGSQKILISFLPHKLDFIIKQGNESIIIEVSDIDWVKTVLEDIQAYKELHDKNKKEQTDTQKSN